MPSARNLNEFMFLSSVFVPSSGDPAGSAAGVHQLRRILLEVRADDADAAALDVEVPGPADRLVVLADLVRLGAVRIEVVLAMEPRPLGNLAVQGQPDRQRLLDRRLVDHRQLARVAEAERTGERVRLGAE